MGIPSSKGFSRSGIYPRGTPDGEIARKISEADETFKARVLLLSEKAFRRYAACHKAPKELEELEWNRYLKILKSML